MAYRPVLTFMAALVGHIPNQARPGSTAPRPDSWTLHPDGVLILLTLGSITQPNS